MNKASFFSGIICGSVLSIIIVVMLMPSMMINERTSPLGFNETIEKIKSNAISEGWVISGISDLAESVKKHGGESIRPTRLINMCRADHASKILNDEKSQKISVFMPCTISVYEKPDGKVYISSMNAGLLGKMFGGVVAEVMGNAVSAQQQKFISFAGN